MKKMRGSHYFSTKKHHPQLDFGTINHKLLVDGTEPRKKIKKTLGREGCWEVGQRLAMSQEETHRQRWRHAPACEEQLKRKKSRVVAHGWSTVGVSSSSG